MAGEGQVDRRETGLGFLEDQTEGGSIDVRWWKRQRWS